MEVHFTLRHWVIRGKEEKTFDSFSAGIVQVVIIGPPAKTSAKTSNYGSDRRTPYRPPEYKLVAEQRTATKQFHPVNVAAREASKEASKGTVSERDGADNSGGDVDGGSTISEWSASEAGDEGGKEEAGTSISLRYMIIISNCEQVLAPLQMCLWMLRVNHLRQSWGQGRLGSKWQLKRVHRFHLRSDTTS